MAIASNFPAIKPSLLLDFANTKKLDPRITFTRTTTATYYDGVTTAKAEENLFLYSQEFDNGAGWAVGGASLAPNSTTAPDGTSTAETLTENSATSSHSVNAGLTVVSGSVYTFSVFAKRNGRDLQLVFGNLDVTGNPYANFDLAAGTVATTSGSITASIVSVGSSWYRCIVTVTAAVSSGFNPFICLINSTAATYVPSYTGDGTSGIYLWGAQLEQRSSVTAYTATTTQPITNYIPVLLTAASGVARFQHNPTTDESLGLLIEEARTNTCLQSEDFSTTWSATRATLSTNSRVSPAGTLTADKLIATTDNNTHFVAQTFTGTAASWTFTVYAKAVDYSFVALRLFNGTSQVGLAYYNLSTGATATVTAGTASIQSVGNGWYRCALTATLAASASCTADIQLASADNTNSFAGNDWNGISIWGAQLEAGAFPTSYIATTSATVTRNADAASMTGTNFSSWYNAAEGTLYTDYQLPFLSSATTQGPAQIDDGSANNRFTLRTSQASNNNAGVVVTSGTTQVALTSTLATVNATQKISLAYKVNDFAYCDKAGTVGTDTAGTVPVTNRMLIGLVGTVDYLNGTIKKIAYYPLRVTNAQLQALTS